MTHTIPQLIAIATQAASRLPDGNAPIEPFSRSHFKVWTPDGFGVVSTVDLRNGASAVYHVSPNGVATLLGRIED